MHPAFNQTDHRPWPLPEGSWLLSQRWLNLAFIHWEIDPAQLRSKIPAQLEIDLFEGKAWIGIVPFDMKGVTFRGLPPVSAFSDFPEINVRTYVECEGKKGVWFFSLDVPKQFAVWTARTFFHLPYRRAKVEVIEQGQSVYYSHHMKHCAFEATYKPTQTHQWDKNSFETWATERYCLYCQSKRGQLYRTEVHHPQWPLEKAEISFQKNTLLDDFEIGNQHPSVLFSRSIDVIAYPPTAL
ncbi:MAG: DUF2071 domain-containing protein [Verrucomicrobia bacterium]|nr:DUF2071 domain-containing protein [Verrucomicrobiota bacterium]MDA1065631.1 DUF2071 domain-containing protein [Verrucomicrobiota bacterium]